jgi:hypothetical protein
VRARSCKSATKKRQKKAHSSQNWIGLFCLWLTGNAGSQPLCFLCRDNLRKDISTASEKVNFFLIFFVNILLSVLLAKMPDQGVIVNLGRFMIQVVKFYDRPVYINILPYFTSVVRNAPWRCLAPIDLFECH